MQRWNGEKGSGYGRSVHTEMYGEVYYVVMNDITEEDS